MTPTCLFEYFFYKEIVSLVVEISRIYAHQKLKPNFELTVHDFRAFLAILLLSGYVPLLWQRMYWDQTSDVHNEAVTGAMSLNRFEDILRHVHLADNTKLDTGDKMAKVRPLFDYLNKRYMQYRPVEEDLDIDESMVPYYGHHSSCAACGMKTIKVCTKCRVSLHDGCFGAFHTGPQWHFQFVIVLMCLLLYYYYYFTIRPMCYLWCKHYYFVERLETYQMVKCRSW